MVDYNSKPLLKVAFYINCLSWWFSYKKNYREFFKKYCFLKIVNKTDLFFATSSRLAKKRLILQNINFKIHVTSSPVKLVVVFSTLCSLIRPSSSSISSLSSDSSISKVTITQESVVYILKTTGQESPKSHRVLQSHLPRPRLQGRPHQLQPHPPHPRLV